MSPRLFCLVLLLVLPGSASAQYGSGTQQLMGNKRGEIAVGCRRVYFGISTGLNNPTGFAGVQIDVAITGRISANFGAGIGTWGTKAALEGRYYFEPCNRGFALGLGGTYSLGGTQITVADVKTQNGTETASFDLRPAFNAMFSGYYFVNLGKRGNRLHFQGGYSLPLHGSCLVQLSGSPIVANAARPLAIIPPGGPIVAMGVSFGIGRF